MTTKDEKLYAYIEGKMDDDDPDPRQLVKSLAEEVIMLKQVIRDFCPEVWVAG